MATSQVSPRTRSSDMTQQARTRVPMSTRRRLARWRVTARRPSSSLRRLPDILIIGAQRCGTSSLYKYLGQHPAVIPSIRKEVEYFSTRYTEGLAWYKSHFPLRRPSSMGQSLTFEATPDVSCSIPCLQKGLLRWFPTPAVIALFEDPVSRAYSQYQHNRRLGHEPLSFDAALDTRTRIGGELERIKVDPVHPARMLRRHGYVERGKYDQQLERWLERFPPNNIHVVRSEDSSPHRMPRTRKFSASSSCRSLSQPSSLTTAHEGRLRTCRARRTARREWDSGRGCVFKKPSNLISWVLSRCSTATSVGGDLRLGPQGLEGSLRRRRPGHGFVARPRV